MTMHIPHGRVILAVRQDSTESKCEYTMTDDHEALFHRAFKDLSEKYKSSAASATKSNCRIEGDCCKEYRVNYSK